MYITCFELIQIIPNLIRVLMGFEDKIYFGIHLLMLKFKI